MAEMTRLMVTCGVLVVLALQGCGGNLADPSIGEINGGAVESRPNILVIVADDLGYNDLGFHGNTQMETPNIDRLFGQSAVFSKNYADATCQPFRNALLTAQSPVRGGFIPTASGIDSAVLTVPERIREAGYRTEHIGKWHQGWLVRDAWPRQQGFDYFYGFLFQRFLQGPVGDGNAVGAGDGYVDPWLMENNSPAEKQQGHLTNLLADRVVDRIETLAQSEQPWFLNYWLYAPHSPIQPADEFIEDDSPAGRYRALVRQMDFNVGRVLMALEQTGQAASTVVVFVSDNGGTNQALDNNAPFLGVKTTYLEGGLRTPMALRVPGYLPQEIGDPVTALDLSETLLALAGVSPSEAREGRDLRRLLDGKSWPHRAHFWEGNHFTGPYQISILSDDGRWRYGEGPNAQRVFFDLFSDPFAQNNLANSAVADQVINQELLPQFVQWHDSQMRHAQGTVDRGGSTQLAGGLRVTPGFSRVSWGLGVPSGAESRASLEQNGVARISVRNGQVFADVYGQNFSGTMSSNEACVPIVISTFGLQPGVNRNDYSIRVSLFVDDDLVDGGVVELATLGDGYRQEIRVHGDDEDEVSFIIWGENLRPQDTMRRAGVQRLRPHLCP